jgi:hypothetical protein
MSITCGRASSPISSSAEQSVHSKWPSIRRMGARCSLLAAERGEETRARWSGDRRGRIRTSLSRMG